MQVLDAFMPRLPERARAALVVVSVPVDKGLLQALSSKPASSQRGAQPARTAPRLAGHGSNQCRAATGAAAG